jgi:hypothetical protein
MHLLTLIPFYFYFLGTSTNVVPRLPDFSLDITSIAKVVEQEKPKCIFLTSPNNPDGRYIFVIHNEGYYSWLLFRSLSFTDLI